MFLWQWFLSQREITLGGLMKINDDTVVPLHAPIDTVIHNDLKPLDGYKGEMTYWNMRFLLQ